MYCWSTILLRSQRTSDDKTTSVEMSTVSQTGRCLILNVFENPIYQYDMDVKHTGKSVPVLEHILATTVKIYSSRSGARETCAVHGRSTCFDADSCKFLRSPEPV